MLAVQFITLLSCMLFTGAAIYITIAEHPARLTCETAVATAVFIPSYQRASVMQATLAMLATIGAIIVWGLGESYLWLVGALLIFFVVPFTFIAIMPVNRMLLGLDTSAAEARRLLVSWGKLHLVRSIVSFVASCLFLSLVIAT